MTDKAILIVEDGDWLGVYVGAHLTYEGHDIEPSRLLEIVGVSHTSTTVDMHAEGWSRLPRTRDELPGFGGESLAQRRARVEATLPACTCGLDEPLRGHGVTCERKLAYQALNGEV